MFHGKKAADFEKNNKLINYLIANQQHEKFPVKHFNAAQHTTKA